MAALRPRMVNGRRAAEQRDELAPLHVAPLSICVSTTTVSQKQHFGHVRIAADEGMGLPRSVGLRTKPESIAKPLPAPLRVGESSAMAVKENVLGSRLRARREVKAEQGP